MQKLKDVLVGSMGVAGMIVWFLIGVVFAFLPLAFLNLSFWLELIIIFVILSIPYIGGLTELGIWVQSFIVVLSQPMSGWIIFYYIVFAIYFFTKPLPVVANIVIGLISELFNKK